MAGSPSASGLVQPPPPLQTAIQTASTAYDVPADLLAGIWRVESASTYPNPAVNKQGYGGLFGTPNNTTAGAPFQNFDIVASAQAQADEAAKILQANLLSAGGNITAALSSYSGGGYTSVPGETTFGYYEPQGSVASGVGSTLVTPSQTQVQQPNYGQGCDHSGASISGCFCGLTGGTKWYEPWTYLNGPVNFFTTGVPCLAEWAYGWAQRLGLLLAAAGLALLGLYLVARDAGAAPSLAPGLAGA